MGSIPEGMGCHILSSIKYHLMQELICFSALYINTSSFLYSLRSPGGGGGGGGG